MSRLKKIKKLRLHREGTTTLVYTFLGMVAFCLLVHFSLHITLLTQVIIAICIIVYCILLNFFQCPVRLYEGDTEKTIMAPCDGRVVVIEEVEENEFFHDKRLMISIFMSILDVHANWFPCDGIVKKVTHDNGRFKAAWLPKASTENERSAVLIETPEGVNVLARQIAGAMARRIVTYAKEGEDCFIDEHMGFIKFGSRVDVYLPIGSEVKVTLGQKTTGNQTVIAKLK
ncbi:MAG: phosphatidylserine decarboxylase family protein [Bacteroidaceae bacterium]|nr:phosphatidylserine decarboxylase family protein [Bacteroidaceae bacterium]